MTFSDIKTMIGPMLTLVFVAGGGWYTLDAVADETENLSTKVETIETKLSEQLVLEVKVENIETRLEKMEKMLEKPIESLQKQMQTPATICQATNASCR